MNWVKVQITINMQKIMSAIQQILKQKNTHPLNVKTYSITVKLSISKDSSGVTNQRDYRS